MPSSIGTSSSGAIDVRLDLHVPLVVRYLLETCDDVASAWAWLARLPYALAHYQNVGDAGGDVLSA